MSTIVLHTTLIVSETVKIEAWFQMTTIGNGIWGIKWSRDPKGGVRQYGQLS